MLQTTMHAAHHYMTCVSMQDETMLSDHSRMGFKNEAMQPVCPEGLLMQCSMESHPHVCALPFSTQGEVGLHFLLRFLLHCLACSSIHGQVTYGTSSQSGIVWFSMTCLGGGSSAQDSFSSHLVRVVEVRRKRLGAFTLILQAEATVAQGHR